MSVSVDPISGQSSPSTSGVDHPRQTVPAASPLVDGQLPRIAVTGGATDTVEALLLSVARGSHEAFVTLQSRMAGLVRVNVRRILRDASRSEAVTQETFAEVLENAISFDPHQGDAQTWLLTRAHQHAIDGLRSVDDTDLHDVRIE